MLREDIKLCPKISYTIYHVGYGIISHIYNVLYYYELTKTEVQHRSLSLM